MASTGFQLFASIAQDANGGVQSFANLSQALSNDTDYAGTGNISAGSKSYRIKVTDASANLSAVSGTVDGIEIKVICYGASSGSQEIYRDLAQLIIGGTQVGTNKGNPGGFTMIAGLETITFGGATDKWGLTPTAAEVKASTFGFAWQVLSDGGSSASTRVYSIYVNIHYTPSGAPTHTATGTLANAHLTMTGAATDIAKATAHPVTAHLTMASSAKATRKGAGVLGSEPLSMAGTTYRVVEANAEFTMFVDSSTLSGSAVRVRTADGDILLEPLAVDGAAFTPSAYASSAIVFEPALISGAAKDIATAAGSLVLEPLAVDGGGGLARTWAIHLTLPGDVRVSGQGVGPIEYCLITIVPKPLRMACAAKVYKSSEAVLASVAVELAGAAQRFYLRSASGGVSAPALELVSEGGTEAASSHTATAQLVHEPASLAADGTKYARRTSTATLVLGGLEIAAEATPSQNTKVATAVLSTSPAELAGTTLSGLRSTSSLDLGAMLVEAAGIKQTTASSSQDLGALVVECSGTRLVLARAELEVGHSIQVSGVARSTACRAVCEFEVAAFELASSGRRVVSASSAVELPSIEAELAFKATRVATGGMVFEPLLVLGRDARRSLFAPGVAYRVVKISHSETGKKVLSLEVLESPAVSNV